MAATVEVGTVLIEGQPPRVAEVLGLESEPYLGNWSVIKVLDGFALDKKIRAAGWNFFFETDEVKVMFFGGISTANVQDALKQILGKKVRRQNFNCLEVTGIVAERFWAIPYVTVSALSRHIQQSCQLESLRPL